MTKYTGVILTSILSLASLGIGLVIAYKNIDAIATLLIGMIGILFLLLGGASANTAYREFITIVADNRLKTLLKEQRVTQPGTTT